MSTVIILDPDPEETELVSASGWSAYPNFSRAEFACKHTGACHMRRDFMAVLQRIRNDFGPLRITSGYRHPSHPVEARKGHTTGEHTQGAACDVAVSGADALRLIQIATVRGITRIGVQQKGPQNTRFIHLGLGGRGLASPAIWSY
jgi:uncharacterized protein YcbK (DUF882 family)